MRKFEAPQDILDLLYGIIDDKELQVFHHRWLAGIQDLDAYAAWYYAKLWEEEFDYRTEGTA